MTILWCWKFSWNSRNSRVSNILWNHRRKIEVWWSAACCSATSRSSTLLSPEIKATRGLSTNSRENKDYDWLGGGDKSFWERFSHWRYENPLFRHAPIILPVWGLWETNSLLISSYFLCFCRFSPSVADYHGCLFLFCFGCYALGNCFQMCGKIFSCSSFEIYLSDVSWRKANLFLEYVVGAKSFDLLTKNMPILTQKIPSRSCHFGICIFALNNQSTLSWYWLSPTFSA